MLAVLLSAKKKKNLMNKFPEKDKMVSFGSTFANIVTSLSK